MQEDKERPDAKCIKGNGGYRARPHAANSANCERKCLEFSPKKYLQRKAYINII